MTLPFNLDEISFDYDLKDVFFDMDAIQNQLVNYYLQNDLRFRRAYNTDFTPSFLKLLQDKARMKEPNFLSISGVVRSAKSYSAITIAVINMALYGKTFTSDYICPNKMAFREKIKDMTEEQTKNSTFLIDEDKGAVYGQGSVARRQDLLDVQNIVAKHNISMLNLCPTKFSNADAHYGLRTMGKAVDKNNPILEDGTPNYKWFARFMLYNLQEGSRGGVLPMGMVYIPSFTKVFPKSFSEPLEAEYLKMKDDWIQEEVRGESDVLAEMRLKVARKFAKDDKCMELKKKERATYISAVLGSGYTVGEINEIVNLTSLIDKGMLPEQ